MTAETKEILFKSITSFLMINGTNFRDHVIEGAIQSMDCLDTEIGYKVIEQGDSGSTVFIVENGTLEVTVNGRTIRTLGSGALFGELALLFDAKRSATVTCTSPCRLWSLDRNAFKLVQRNASNLAIITRTRRFLVVPELAALPSTSLARLMATLTPMTYKRGDSLYSTGKCSNKVMLIEEGTVTIKVPNSMQHLSQDEIERAVGIYRPLEHYEMTKSGREHDAVAPGTGRRGGGGSDDLPADEFVDDQGDVYTKSFTIGEGCVIGMHILLGKIGSARGWVWIDAKVDGKPYVGGMPPVTAVAADGDVKTAFFTVYRFERIFGSAEQFYEAYFEVAMREHAEQEMLLRYVLTVPPQAATQPRASVCNARPPPMLPLPMCSIGEGDGLDDLHRETSLDGETHTAPHRTALHLSSPPPCRPALPPGVKYDLAYFDKVELIAPISMGFAALATKALPGNGDGSADCKDGDDGGGPTVVREYVLKRLNKTAVVAQKFVRVVKAESAILSSLNNPFIAKLYGKFQTPDELVLVLERCTGGDLWTVIYEEEQLRDEDGFLPMHVVRFYAGSIVLALEHMHDRQIAYRNLKPETVLLDSHGYIRLTGMGFAKRVPFINAQGTLSGQTFTFCGTLEYLAPEMVLNMGHDQGVDKWALGVTMYEMIAGVTPFEIDNSTAFATVAATPRRLSRDSSPVAVTTLATLSEAAEALEHFDESRRGSTVTGSPMDALSALHKSGKDIGSALTSLAEVDMSQKHTDRSVESEQPETGRQLDPDEAATTDGATPSRRDSGISKNESKGDNKRRVSHMSSSSMAAGGKTRDSAVDNTSKLLGTIAATRNLPAVHLPHDFTHMKDGNAVTALILQLLAPDATERVGIRRDYVNNIFEHDFFADYDWQQLTDKHVPPPFTPKPHMDISVGKTRAEEIPFPKSEPFTGSQAIFENF
jgi:serine/threonine protein kinase/CRP-like cAMP-binding protein